MKYAIIGTGALGGYYGGKLALNGHEVHFLLRSDFEFVQQYGLRVDSVEGNFTLNQINAYNSAEHMPKCDVVCVCLKTTQNNVLDDILPHICHKDTIVVLIQNGLGMERDLAQKFPQLRIAGGLAFICSSKLGPGFIHHQDYGYLNLAPYTPGTSVVLNHIVADFNGAGVKANLLPDLRVARWQKLVWNVPYNGLCVVMNSNTDALMKQPSTRKLCEDIMWEVYEAARANNVVLKQDFVSKMLESTEKMISYAPSMKLDYDAKRPLEVDYIYSLPVKLAKGKGVKMPKTDMLEQQLRFLDAQNKWQ